MFDHILNIIYFRLYTLNLQFTYLQLVILHCFDIVPISISMRKHDLETIKICKYRLLSYKILYVGLSVLNLGKAINYYMRTLSYVLQLRISELHYVK